MASNTIDLISLTDCRSFENGQCVKIKDCPYRHSPTAIRQTTACVDWPYKCRRITCPYKHPSIISHSSATAKPLTCISSPPKTMISIFWDIENVPIPKNQNPFDIVQRIRQKLIIDAGLREDTFSCYCDVQMIPKEKQLNLAMANVRMLHVPDRKPNAVDRLILLDLDRFERVHRPPATVVLISGDIDFVGKLSDLRHQAGYRVIVIHNRSTKVELTNTVDECYAWDIFTDAERFTAFFGTVKEATVESHRNVNQERKRSHRSRSRRRPDRSKSRPRSVMLAPSVPQSIVPKPTPVIVSEDTMICPKCPCRFGTIAALRQHQTAKNHLFECPVCKELFQTAVSLSQHQTSKNHRLTDYRCIQCNRSFPKLESLNQHQQAVGHLSQSIVDDPNEKMRVILEGIEVIKLFYMKEEGNNNN